MKIELKAGINSADARKRVPKTKAPMLNMFEKSPSFTMEALLRELKPCHKRAKQRVAKAIVCAVSTFVFSPQ